VKLSNNPGAHSATSIWRGKRGWRQATALSEPHQLGIRDIGRVTRKQRRRKLLLSQPSALAAAPRLRHQAKERNIVHPSDGTHYHGPLAEGILVFLSACSVASRRTLWSPTRPTALITTRLLWRRADA